jgi:DNA-binding transcriptional ArsR family regulator
VVKHLSPRLDAVFNALADPTRRGILAHLARSGEVSVTELSEPHPISAPAISKHLRVLEKAGLITREKQGRVRYCRINTDRFQYAAQWLETMQSFWEKRLDSLERYFREHPE